MKFQRDKYSCGPLAILNALRAMGKKVTEKRVRAHTATVRGKGTTEHAIKNALERLGFRGEDLNFMPGDFESAFRGVHGYVRDGRSVLLYVDKDHWVAAVGVCGDRVVVFDSERTPANRVENGVHVYDTKRLSKRWLKSENGLLYALVVSRET